MPVFRRMLKTYRQKRELKRGKDKKVPQNEEEKKKSNAMTPRHKSSLRSAKAISTKENKRKLSENNNNDDTNIFPITAEVIEESNPTYNAKEGKEEKQSLGQESSIFEQ